MVQNYLRNNDLEILAKNYMGKYASQLIQNQIDNGRKITPNEIVSSIKEAVCFEALRTVSSPDESIEKLQERSQFLADKLTDKNIRILNDKEFLRESLTLDISTSTGARNLSKSIQDEKSLDDAKPQIYATLIQKEDIQKEISREVKSLEVSI